MKDIEIIIRGPIKSGKTTVAIAIEQALRSVGFDFVKQEGVRLSNPETGEVRYRQEVKQEEQSAFAAQRLPHLVTSGNIRFHIVEESVNRTGQN